MTVSNPYMLDAILVFMVIYVALSILRLRMQSKTLEVANLQREERRKNEEESRRRLEESRTRMQESQARSEESYLRNEKLQTRYEEFAQKADVNRERWSQLLTRVEVIVEKFENRGGA